MRKSVNILLLNFIAFASVFAQDTQQINLNGTVVFSVECQDISVDLNAENNEILVKDGVLKSSTHEIIQLTVSRTLFTCENVGENEVIVSATDINGSVASCTGIVHVVDRIYPEVICMDLTVYLDDSGESTISHEDIVQEYSDNCSDVTFTLDQSSFTGENIGVNTVFVGISDLSDNTASCVGNVTVLDTTSATLVCQDVTIALDESGNANITVDDVLASYDDNSSEVTIDIQQTNFDNSHIGVNDIEVSATDQSGNYSSCYSIVTVSDVHPPVAICTDISVFLDNSGIASVTAEEIDGGSFDNGTIVSMSLSQYEFDQSDIGDNLNTLTVSDEMGNMNSCIANVSVFDSTPPNTYCQDITVQMDGTGNVSITPAMIDNGSTDNAVIVSETLDIEDFDCTDVGPNAVTLTVTDNSGNVSTCTATVAIEDNENPSITTQNISISLDVTGNANILSTDVLSASYDNCGSPIITLSQEDFNCAHIGANTVTVTATDANGNTTTNTAVVTVEDNVNPTAVCQDISVGLDASGSASIAASDIDGGSTDACGIESLNIDISTFTSADLGENNVQLTVLDMASNQSTCNAIVTITDENAPNAQCQDITVQLDDVGTAEIEPSQIDNGSSDNGTIVSMSLSQYEFDQNDLGDNNITLTVTNDAGYMSSCTATATVIDSTPPVIVCQDITVLLDASGSASILASDVENFSYDNTTGIILTIDRENFDCDNVGSNLVTLVATDGSGNSSSCISSVNVKDNMNPEFIFLPAIIGECAAAVIAPTTTDNCSGSILGTTSDPLFYTTQGIHVITWKFEDDNGNSINLFQNVVIVDMTDPVSPILSDILGECSATVTAPIATDICAGAVTGTTVDPITYSNQGTHVITWNFDDGNGNSINVNQLVIINDLTDPDFGPLPDLTILVFENIPIPNATDNCGGAITPITGDPISFSTEGTYVITWDADDGNGNSVSQNQTIIVISGFGASSSLFQDSSRGTDVNNVNNTVYPENEFSEKNIGMSLYPNPAENGFTTLVLNDMPTGNKTINVAIYNSLGTALRYESFKEHAQDIKLKLDYLSAFSPGVYTIYVNVDGKQQSQQLIIRH